MYQIKSFYSTNLLTIDDEVNQWLIDQGSDPNFKLISITPQHHNTAYVLTITFYV